MLIWPDWNKLYAKWDCLYYGEAWSDEQWEALNNAKTKEDREALVRKFREEYLKNRDIVTGKLKEELKAETPIEEPTEEAEEAPEVEESIEDVKPVKKNTKKGK